MIEDEFWMVTIVLVMVLILFARVASEIPMPAPK